MTSRIPSYSVKLTQSAVSLNYQRPVPNPAPSPLNQAPTAAALTNLNVAENAPPGFLVGTLTTTDPNTDQTHVYKLVNDAGGRFALQGDKLLRTGIPIDYESATSHAITVRSTDPGGLFVDQPFTINVVNVPEAATDITLTNRVVPENSTVDTVVGTLAVVGADAGSTYTYTLPQDAGGRFKIVGTSLKVAVASINYELNSFHDITVAATDQFNNTISKTFTLLVSDINEAPTDISITNVSVPENVSAGYVVGSLSVTDPDRNGSVTFSLTNTAGNRFAISGTDLIRGATALDYETSTSHSITVLATDQDGLTFSKDFTIQVADVVEGGPANTAPTDITLSNSGVDELSAAGAVIGQFAVVDPDAGNTHTLVLTNDAGGRFALSTTKQLIVGLNPIKYTDGDQTISVRATDQGGLSYVKSFTITVRDVAQAPTGININATVVNENSAPGTVIGGLSTLDPDANQSFTYSLTDTHGGRFAINGNNLVCGTTPLDYETASQYVVEIKSTDNTGLSYIKQFSIVVIDIAEGGGGGGGGTSVTDTPSTWNPVIPWLVAGRDFPVGRISANPLKNPATVPGVNGAGTNYTYITVAGVYEDINFGATKLAVHVSGVTFRNCIVNDGWAPAPPPYGQGPEVCGRYHQDGARVDFDLEWCTVLGTKRGTSVSPQIDNNNGVTSAYRCLLQFGASDGFKVGGGHIYECCYELGGYDPGAHQDGMEVTRLVANLEVYRCYFDVQFYGDPNSGSNGAIKFYVEAGQPMSNLPAGLDLLFEENVCHANASPNCSNYIIRPGTTGGSTGRFLNNFVSKWQTWPSTAAGNFWTGDSNYNTLQGTRDHFRNGLPLADVGVTTKPQPPIVTASSPNATTIQLIYADISPATYHEYRVRPVGSARWSMARKVPTNKQITGLISNVEYEFKVRAVNGRTTGDWSNTQRQQVGAATTAPGVVTNLTVQQANSNGFVLAFTDAPNATSYQYRVATGTGAAPGTPSTAIPGGGVLAPGFDYTIGRTSGVTLKVPGVDTTPAGMSVDPTYSTCYRITADDFVLQDWNFSNHRVEIWGKRVKIKQCKFGRSGVPNYGSEAVRNFPACILIKANAADYEVTDNTFDATGSALPGSSMAIVQEDQLIQGKVLRNDFSNMPSDCIGVHGGEVAYNRINIGNGRNTGSHYDAMEMIGNNFPMYIHDNYFEGTGVNGTNSCIKLYEELGGKFNADIFIYNNYFSGGGHQIMTFDGAANNGFFDGPGIAHVYDNYFFDNTIYGAGGYITNAAFSPGNPTPKSVRFTRNRRVGAAATTLGAVIPDINPEVLGTTFTDWATLSAKTITGLQATTQYTIEVRALNGSTPGNAVQITGTTAAASAPGAMGTISLISKTDTQFVVAFTAIAGANSYEYRRKNPIGGGTYNSFAALTTTGSGTLNATIGGLTAATGYDIEIRAVNTTGNGTASLFSNTTDAAPTGDADATALFGRMTTAGASAPSGWQSAITAFITALKNAGIWNSVITGKMAAVHSASVTQLDWKNSSYDGTKQSSPPTFTAKVGYANDYGWYIALPLAASALPSSCTIVARGVGPFGATWDNAYIGGNQSHYISLDTTTGYPVTRYRHDSHTTGPNIDARGKDIFLWGDTTTAHCDVDGTVYDYSHSNVVDTANMRFVGRGGQYSAGCLCTAQHFWAFDRILTATERNNFRTAMANYFTAIGAL